MPSVPLATVKEANDATRPNKGLCFDVSPGFGGSPESGSVPERSVLGSSGTNGRAAEPQVGVNAHSVH